MWKSGVTLARALRPRSALRLGSKASSWGAPATFKPAAACHLLWSSETQFSQSGQPKDYALPNASWSQGMLNLYNEFVEKSKDGTWKRIPSYRHSLDHIPDLMKLEGEKMSKDTRLFLRSLDEEGLGFEYVMFLNPSEKRMVTVYQPGPYLEGHPGFAHGGSTAAIIDSTIGGCAIFVAGRVMTANLSIDFKNPIPLGSVVLVDGKVNRMEGRKVFLSCQVWSADGQTLHAEATALFIQLDSLSRR
ncbi:PREDICTED: acyl-coenzyme A thioesterase THEM4 [Crocodylus porosus]|uniref:acyl-coenzyme A thioesterase THEM4 n=1 Tax=Crocodylus porosus TaxID=8502 RepID=UPI00093C91F7|nr:PREDICTED: acyl-coenzyme A thioesterase THEM4 [Crocodylus porosus]XP_019412438.1 PREDICTED: acyl-coenzyme A thioesterase THEM4 [Crocodylus porosus]